MHTSSGFLDLPGQSCLIIKHYSLSVLLVLPPKSVFPSRNIATPQVLSWISLTSHFPSCYCGSQSFLPQSGHRCLLSERCSPFTVILVPSFTSSSLFGIPVCSFFFSLLAFFCLVFHPFSNHVSLYSHPSSSQMTQTFNIYFSASERMFKFIYCMLELSKSEVNNHAFVFRHWGLCEPLLPRFFHVILRRKFKGNICFYISPNRFCIQFLVSSPQDHRTSIYPTDLVLKKTKRNWWSGNFSSGIWETEAGGSSQSLGDGSVDKCVLCSRRGLKLGSQHPPLVAHIHQELQQQGTVHHHLASVCTLTQSHTEAYTIKNKNESLTQPYLFLNSGYFYYVKHIHTSVACACTYMRVCERVYSENLTNYFVPIWRGFWAGEGRTAQ